MPKKYFTMPKGYCIVPKFNRGYAYQYDNLNRLKAAFYQKAGTVTNAYNESLTYDKNGNILSLNRNGTSETATAIDKLAYTYSHNQLLKVADTANKTQGFVDDTNTDNDFTYDVNGNMTMKTIRVLFPCFYYN